MKEDRTKKKEAPIVLTTEFIQKTMNGVVFNVSHGKLVELVKELGASMKKLADGFEAIGKVRQGDACALQSAFLRMHPVETYCNLARMCRVQPADMEGGSEEALFVFNLLRTIVNAARSHLPGYTQLCEQYVDSKGVHLSLETLGRPEFLAIRQDNPNNPNMSPVVGFIGKHIEFLFYISINPKLESHLGVLLRASGFLDIIEPYTKIEYVT